MELESAKAASVKDYDLGKEQKVKQDVESLRAGDTNTLSSSSTQAEDTGNLYHFNVQQNRPREDAGKRDNKVKEGQHISDCGSLISAFFTGNVIAKIGGVLLFLGVVFFLRLFYQAIGPVAKVIMGFVVGFAVYGSGVLLDQRKYRTEGRILLGVGILINYLIILSGRYLIGDNYDDSFVLSESLTFIFLTLNTILAVITALVYQSNTLLLFSIILAYLNPFLIGAPNQTAPYTLCGYGVIVSIGAIILGLIIKGKTARTILRVAFIGGNLLAVIAPYDTAEMWYFKLAVSVSLSLGVLVAAYRCRHLVDLIGYVFGAYLSLFAMICVSANAGGFAYSDLIFEIAHPVSYLFYLAIICGATVILFVLSQSKWLFECALLPVICIALLIAIGGIPLAFQGLVMGGVLVFYIILILLLGELLTAEQQKLTFVSIGALLFYEVLDLHLNAGSENELLLNPSLGVIVTALLFMGTSSIFSFKRNLEVLYSLSSIMTAMMLFPMLQKTGELVNYSIFSILVYAAVNILVPVLNKNLRQNGYKEVVIGIVCGALFISYEIYYYGLNYFPGLTIGLAYLGLAVVYFAVALFTLPPSIKETDAHWQNIAKDGSSVVQVVLGVSLSLFSLAIAFVFSKYPQVIGVIWLLEASLLFFLYGRVNLERFYLAGVILSIIGLSKLVSVLGVISAGEWLMIVPLIVAFLSFVINIRSLGNLSDRLMHGLCHVFGMIALGYAIIVLSRDLSTGGLFVAVSLYCAVLSYLYSRHEVGWIKYCFAIALLSLYYLQILHQAEQSTGTIQWLCCLSTVILGYGAFFFKRPSAATKLQSGGVTFAVAVICSFCLYAYIISSLYVYNISANRFVVTIYWGMLALGLLGYGMRTEVVRYRSIGLYVLALTVIKILFSDIWYGLDNAGTRVAALLIVGVIMIVISMLYTKKYGDNLKDEINPRNLL